MFVCKEECDILHPVDKLNLAKATRKGGTDKCRYFSTDRKPESDSKTVYDLHMRVDTLLSSLKHYDMENLFQIIP